MLDELKKLSGKWKDKNGVVYKMMDCSIEQLEGFKSHCNMMLHNTKKHNLGRYPLIKLIDEYVNKCNVELFRRYVVNVANLPTYKLINKINNEVKDKNEYITTTLFKTDDANYHTITVDEFLDSLLDKLGYFDKKPLTNTFITNQGIWLTDEELDEYKGSFKQKIEKIKKDLNLRKDSVIRINPKGLSLHEMKVMLKLKSNKISNLTSDELKILRDKVLFLLRKDVERHIGEWENRITLINNVIDFKQGEV